MSTPTSEVLYRAADLIEKRGWAGALNWPSARDAWGLGPADSTRLCLEGGIYVALWNWNDDRRRTADEVIDTLRAAAMIEAAKETTPVDLEARESVTA